MLRPLGIIAVGSTAIGAFVAIFNMFEWTSRQHFFAQASASSSFVASFYAAEFVSVALILLGLYAAFRSPGAGAAESHLESLLSIIASAVSDRGLHRLAVVVGVLYGILYLFVSSIFVFQPVVDFSTYGATGVASWGFVPCCGDVGTLPKLILYVPGAHFAVQLVPLSLLLLFIVPPLVGLNTSIALFSVRRTVAKLTGRWMVACGSAVGLFTACPTCAGIFLAESVGGVWATTLAVALAPYQLLFIALSIPLLVTMPFLFAARVRRAAPPPTRVTLAGSVQGPSDRTVSAGNR